MTNNKKKYAIRQYMNKWVEANGKTETFAVYLQFAIDEHGSLGTKGTDHKEHATQFTRNEAMLFMWFQNQAPLRAEDPPTYYVEEIS